MYTKSDSRTHWKTFGPYRTERGFADSPFRLDVTIKAAVAVDPLNPTHMPKIRVYASGHRTNFPRQIWEERSPENSVKLFPEGIAPLIKSNGIRADGRPGSLCNAFYFFAGAFAGLGEEYHAGNGSFSKSPVECAKIVKEMLRIDEHDFQRIVSRTIHGQRKEDTDTYKTMFANVVKEMCKRRWEIEAQEIIDKYGLPFINVEGKRVTTFSLKGYPSIDREIMG